MPQPLEEVLVSRQSLDPAAEIVALAGDWETDAVWARHALGVIARRGHTSGARITTILHVGDFGYWPRSPRGRQYLSEVDGALRGHGQYLYITPGNHEDHNALAEVPVGDGALQWVTDRIALIPRGHRWEMGGRIWVSLGGAPSVDYPQRRAGRTWFAEEAITDEDVNRLTAGGPAHIMLTHDSPSPGTPAVERIIGRPGPWQPEALRYAAEGRSRLTTAFEAVQPTLLVHGHYHVRDSAEVPVGDSGAVCELVSLAAHGMPGNLAILDLRTEALRWNWVDI